MGSKCSPFRHLVVAVWLTVAAFGLGPAYAASRILVEPGPVHLWSGEMVNFGLRVVAGETDRDCSLQWEFLLSSVVLARGGRRLGVGPGEPEPIPVQFEAPRVRHPSRVEWRFRLARGETIVASNQVALRVYPAWDPQPLRALLSSAEVAIADGSGRLRQMLDEHGLGCEALSTPLAVRAFGGRVIVLGPEGDQSPDLAKAVLEAAVAGHTVVWLEPGDISGWQADLGLPKAWPADRPELVMLAPDHPALAGISPDDLIGWRGETGLVLVADAPTSGNFRGLVASPGERAGFGLLELFPGRGRLVICQLPVVSRFDAEPAARMLFESVLRYAFSETLTFSTANLWAPPESGLPVLARKSGLKPSEEAVASGLLIVAADPDAAEYFRAHEPSLTDRIRAHLESGGRSLMIGAAPESIPFLERCGLRISLTSAPEKADLQPSPLPLVWGISSQQLAAAAKTGEASLLQYTVVSSSDTQVAVTPGAIVKIRVGAGEAVLCQLALQRAPEDPTVIALFRQLLTNLGVRLEREDQP